MDKASAKEDALVRDKKQVPLSGISVVPMFAGFVFLAVPAWLVVLLPAAILSQLAILALSPFTPKPKPVKEEDVAVAETPVMLSTDTGTRNLDLVVFGATGFTGKLACAYLAKTYGRTIKWGVAGRRRDALEKVRGELGPEFHDLPILIADSTDQAALNAMATRTKVVISTAGPFSLHGSGLVAACAAHGTHYCDITGEADWVRRMVLCYDDLARRSGSRVVHFCGHDCVPWDMSVLALAQEMRRRGDTLAEARCFDEMSGAVSGGTVATVLLLSGQAAAAAPPPPRRPAAAAGAFDPLLRTAAGARSENRLVARLQAWPGYAREVSAWVGPFFMAPVMAACVRRSNALGAFGATGALVYREAAVFPGLMAAVVQLGGLVVLATAMAIPPVRWLLFRAGALPQPGEGPSERAMDAGFLRVTALGRGVAGTTARSVLYFPTDPGYRDTARMLCESGLLLALEPHRAPNAAPGGGGGGGVLTPAAGLGAALLDRLVATGCSFSVA